MVVACNRTVTVSRPPQTNAPGLGAYMGRTEATDVVLVRQWPASVLDGGRMEGSRADLPGDVPMRGASVLLPWPGVVIQTSDRIEDDQGRAFTVASAELTDLGYRIATALSAG